MLATPHPTLESSWTRISLLGQATSHFRHTPSPCKTPHATRPTGQDRRQNGRRQKEAVQQRDTPLSLFVTLSHLTTTDTEHRTTSEVHGERKKRKEKGCSCGISITPQYRCAYPISYLVSYHVISSRIVLKGVASGPLDLDYWN